MYVTEAQVRESGAGLTSNSSQSPPLTDALLTALIERASRFFDKLCVVPSGYFEAASNSASPRTLYSSGGVTLSLPPYVAGSLSLAFPDGYTAQTYVERGGYLALADSNGVLYQQGCYASWYMGVPITATAKWGYATTPADVVFAVIELVINLFRETDPAALKLTNPDGSYLRESVPPRVAEIARRYRFSEARVVAV